MDLMDLMDLLSQAQLETARRLEERQLQLRLNCPDEVRAASRHRARPTQPGLAEQPGLADRAVAAPRICGPGSLDGMETVEKQVERPVENVENDTVPPMISATVVLDCLSLLPAKDVQSKSCSTEIKNDCLVGISLECNL